MKVAVIAPHMDDEVLGVGGTLAKHVRAGHETSVCIVANRAYNHRYDRTVIERQKASSLTVKELLGYKGLSFLELNDEQLDDKAINVIVPLERYLGRMRPDVVYVPHRSDVNQDHRAVFNAALVACRSFANPGLKRILSYETPSSTDQASPFPDSVFSPNYYVGIEPFLDLKLRALDCYQDECRRFPHPRSAEAVTALARKRGAEMGIPAAEAFMVVRWKWD